MESLIDNSFDRQRISALSWPHGILTLCRTVLLFDVLLARFMRILCAPPQYNMAEDVFIFLLTALLLSEAVYSFAQIHQHGHFWTKMLLFYPLQIVVMFVDGLCVINSLNRYRILALFLPMGWPIFWASLELICSLAIPVICCIHLCLDNTFGVAMEEFRQFIANVMQMVRDGPHSTQNGPVTRNGYEDIQ